MHRQKAAHQQHVSSPSLSAFSPILNMYMYSTDDGVLRARLLQGVTGEHRGLVGDLEQSTEDHVGVHG